MAHTKSAEKRLRQSEKSRISHKAKRSELKTMEKGVREKIDDESIENIKSQAAKMMSKLDKAVKSGTIHPNKVSRKKSQIARLLQKKAAAAKS